MSWGPWGGPQEVTGYPESARIYILKWVSGLTDDFQKWYDGRNFDEPNDHGIWNGQNLLGFDPLGYYRKYREGRVQATEAIPYRDSDSLYGAD